MKLNQKFKLVDINNGYLLLYEGIIKKCDIPEGLYMYDYIHNKNIIRSHSDVISDGEVFNGIILSNKPLFDESIEFINADDIEFMITSEEINIIQYMNMTYNMEYYVEGLFSIDGSYVHHSFIIKNSISKDDACSKLYNYLNKFYYNNLKYVYDNNLDEDYNTTMITYDQYVSFRISSDISECNMFEMHSYIFDKPNDVIRL